MSAPRAEQFSGCLVGQCLGDALGAPIEGCNPRTAAAYIKAFRSTSLVELFGRGRSSFGQYTDDSQLAQELMQSYVACGRFDPADYARRIADIFIQGRIVGPGAATSDAAFRLAKGVSWEEAGTPPPSAGNGSAMRAGPIGLFYFDYPDRLIQAARDQGRITHQDPRCSAGAVAIAGAVALGMQTESIETAAFLTTLTGWARIIEPSVADALEGLNEWVTMPPDEAVPHISIAGLDAGWFDPWQGISPFVTSSVTWSLYAFLRTPDDYLETIFTAIRAGGDVDTMAAMAGAISGAHLGLEAIPADLAHCLTDQGTWGYSELVQLAEQCYDLKMQSQG
jgi:ADP-ribosylglycohydrolase